MSRQPETRIFCVLTDGTVRVLMLDLAEDVQAWSRITTTGTIEDVVILPGVEEDRVYFSVNRDDGRYLEKLALQSEAQGASMSKHFDSFVTYSSPGTDTLTGLDHVEGETVRAWADGDDVGSFTVSSGSITVPSSSYTDVCVGLPYNADMRSNRLSDYIDQDPFVDYKRIVGLGFIMQNAHRGLLQYGSDENNLQSMPLIERGSDDAITGIDTVYDELPVEFDGVYETDPRVFLRATGPATILALGLRIDDPMYSATKGG